MRLATIFAGVLAAILLAAPPGGSALAGDAAPAVELAQRQLLPDSGRRTVPLQPPGRVTPGPQAQPFECSGGYCRCEGTADCADMGRFCEDQPKCDGDVCTCKIRVR